MKHQAIFADRPLIESAPSSSRAAMRRLFHSEGYIFIRNLFPSALVLGARHEVIQLAKNHRLIEEKIALGHAFMRAGISRKQVLRLNHQFISEWTRRPKFKSLGQAPVLLQMLNKITGKCVEVHPGEQTTWGRVGFPSRIVEGIVAHQDFQYVGDPQPSLTAWVPMGDCPVYLGGLAVSPRSQKLGHLRHHPNNGLDRMVDDLNWRTADFRTGDCLIFNSLVVHKPLPNLTEMTVRFSADFRFCY